MPLTKYQAVLAKRLAINRTPDSHLAGGAALHFKPNTLRYSADLDYFHDSEQRVATAFAQDHALLLQHGYQVLLEIKQPGYIRAQVCQQQESTKIEWSHDSSWRFMPAIQLPEAGYLLHPVDLAINKLLALAGRDEPRDFLDVLYVHKNILSLGALCWAAVGKDPGFTPVSLLELIKRRGKYQADDFKRLQLRKPVVLTQLKLSWLEAIAAAEKFIEQRPTDESGCLYYSKRDKKFVTPILKPDSSVVLHHGKPGGIIPKFYDIILDPTLTIEVCDDGLD